MGEFSLLSKLRQLALFRHPLTDIANGDDASVHNIPTGMSLAVSTDAAVYGVHWPEDMALDMAARRATAAALSDLAAMGAQPTWLWSVLQAKTSQNIDALHAGVCAVARKNKVEIAGGDIVRANQISLSLTVAGIAPNASMMRRDTANIGDDIWLCGRVGFASLGLYCWQKNQREHPAISSFCNVYPLIDIGQKLRCAGVRCCIDISDGLIQDAGHIAQASAVGLDIFLDKLPDWKLLLQYCCGDQERAAKHALTGGDDYALLCTASPTIRHSIPANAILIGQCVARHGLKIIEPTMTSLLNSITNNTSGYQHF
ncbi:MAG: thiamine-phosphate kinase [Mariprofundales bacterium]